MKVEQIRRRYFKRIDIDNLNAVNARKNKVELRKCRSKLREQPDSTDLKAEALKLVDDYITVMDAFIKGDIESALLERGRESFQRYVDAVERAVLVYGE